MDTTHLLGKFNYVLPEELIAHEPASPRDSSRLLVINRTTGKLSHHIFFELGDVLDENCILVFNDTKVYPARLFGKKPNGKDVEVLLTKKRADGTWEALCHPGVKPGTVLNFGESHLTVLSLYNRAIIIKPNVSEKKFWELIEKNGHMPLPPYIHTTVSAQHIKEKYQTVYAKETGSAAAPTAGLHFTEGVFETLKKKGIETVHITLHVGLGTFAPVDETNIQEKRLHSEYVEITKTEAARINVAKKNGKKIIAVGTTSLRALESAADETGYIHPFAKDTSIFIFPGYQFKIVTGLITNFHVPNSSLLMLVSAFCSYPNTKNTFVDFTNSLVGHAYQQAMKHQYRFFSFGDATLIL